MTTGADVRRCRPDRRPAGALAAAAVAGLLLGLVAADAQTPHALDCGIEAGPTRAVAGIVDAATIRLDDGKEARLAGIVVPSARDAGAHSGSWPPESEARAALAALVAGRNVALGLGSRREDRWGRVPAHLFVEQEGEQVWVQGRLVALGHARAGPAPDDDACAPRLLEREREARGAGRGLWASSAYHIRPADRPSELARYQGSFQLVRGIVERVGGTRSLVVVELASGEEAAGAPAQPGAADAGRRSRRGTMRVVWRRSLDTGLAATGGLVGSTVLVRGWIDVRAGPEIELLAKGQVEVEAAAVSAGRRDAGGDASPSRKGKRPAGGQPGVDGEQKR